MPLLPPGLNWQGTWWLGLATSLFGLHPLLRTLRPERPSRDGAARPRTPVFRALAMVAAVASMGLAAFATYADLTASELPIAGVILGCAVLGLALLATA